MDRTVEESLEDPDFTGPRIRKEDMGFSSAPAMKSDTRLKDTGMEKLNKSNISESGRQTFGITIEEWMRMQEEEDKDEKTREYLRGLEKEYVKINEDCSSRMDPLPVL
ncbi:hypothetical protein RclHR1_01350024 [Rhizophagus clarus]|uniref:Uncharacterized protein n=1 Tax=Rhizophagus clarus TaxID=94130 RepID=A0A2Z6QMJ6_9GLOM|nr:hypothetical protein RclHR1_01350024 [Rhizophagus clarus]GES98958.1 hypothetical protein RCL_jg993.t1 [Rhizophagus clarus]